LDVEVAKAGHRVLAAHQSEQQSLVVVAEEVEALVGVAPVVLGPGDLVILQRASAALNEQVAEVKRMLYRFMQSLRSSG
jgi:2-keto-3-deoxy-L-rhamnonate aldolase RhmA